MLLETPNNLLIFCVRYCSRANASTFGVYSVLFIRGDYAVAICSFYVHVMLTMSLAHNEMSTCSRSMGVAHGVINYQLLDEVEQNIVICPWRADQLFADAVGRGK